MTEQLVSVWVQLRPITLTPMNGLIQQRWEPAVVVQVTRTHTHKIHSCMLATYVCVNHKCLCWTGVGVLKSLLYAVGGHDGPLVRKSCEVYDPATNTWTQVADMNMCRRNAGEFVRSLLNSTVCHSASWHTHTQKNSSCDGIIKFVCFRCVCCK